MDMEINFPNLGIYLDHVGKNISIFGFSIAYYGIVIVTGMMIAIWIAQREAKRTGQNPEQYLDLAMIGIAAGILGARIYYVIFAWDYYKDDLLSIFNIRQGGLAIYGGIIGAFVFGGLACKWRGVPVLPMFDLAGMGFLIGQGCGRWGNFFNQEAFGCNTTLPWGMFSEATEDYLMGSTVTVPKGVTIDPAMPVHPTFLYESIWCFVGLALLVAYIKKRKFNGDIALRYLVWYGAGRFWIESLRTDSLLLVPSLGLRASQLVAAAAVVGGVALEIFLTRKYKSRPLMVTLALTAENRSLLAKVRKAEPEFTVEREELVASSPRKLFLERTNAYNERVKQQLKEKLAEKN